MNRLLQLKEDIKSYNSVIKKNKVQPKKANSKDLVQASTKPSKCKQMSEIEVDGDEFVLDILEYFFHERLEEKYLNDALRQMAAKVLHEAIQASKSFDYVPRPPAGKPGYLWLISQAVQIGFRKANNQCIYQAVKDTITVKWRSAYRIEVNQSKMGSAQSVESMAMGDALYKTALVVFLENTGALPFSWPGGIGTDIKKVLEETIDKLAEDFVKWLNKFKAAKGSHYDEVIILEDSKATFDNLKSTIHSLAKKGFYIDIFTLTHGNSTSFTGYKGVSISDTDIRKIRDDYGKELPIGIVYMMNCKGGGLIDDWTYAGAMAVAGSDDNNYMPEPMLSKFWTKWKKGYKFEKAVSEAYTESLKIVTEKAETIASGLKTTGTIISPVLAYLIGNPAIDSIVSKVKQLAKDSKPRVSGYQHQTINSAKTGQCQSLSINGNGLSEASYGTGEHVIAGLVDETPVSSAYKIDINGVKFSYAEIMAMGDLFENYNQMVKAGTSELTRLQTLIDKSKRYYEGKVLTGTSGTNTSDSEWEKATGGRYLKLAEDNFSHFAPSSGLISFTSAKDNHKKEWEKYHATAIGVVRKGVDSTVMNKAMAINAFGDHFLTDAFASGHLFNKDDLNVLFKSKVLSGGKVNSTGEQMFGLIAEKAFKGKLKSTFSKYETYEPYEAWWNIFNWNPNIHNESRFKTLLIGIMQAQPDIIGKSLIAKLVHDALNDHPGGIIVTNNKGKTWNLTGDGSLNKQNLEIMRTAVKQSIRNVNDAVNDKSALSVFYKKVWDYTPRHTAVSSTLVKNIITRYTNPTGKELTDGAAKILQDNFQTLLDELVKRKILKKA